MPHTDDLFKRVEDFIEEREYLKNAIALDTPELIRATMQYVSLRGIGRECGLSPTYLSNVLNGKSQISMESYLVLGRLYERIKREHDAEQDRIKLGAEPQPADAD